MFRTISVLLVVLCATSTAIPPAAAEIVSLKSLSQQLTVSAQQISVSGISSGAYMAHQMHVIHSKHITGAGVIAGGPYHCAAGSYSLFTSFDLTGLYAATSRCSNTNPYWFFQGPPDVNFSIRDTHMQASNGVIDDPDNLRTDKVWLFSGGRDETVPGAVMDTLETYYREFMDPGNVVYVKHEAANHAMITDDFDNDCAVYGSPYINDCDIDAAKDLLQHIYGPLNPKAAEVQVQPILEFDQTEFFNEGDESVSMNARGHIYVPKHCIEGESCRLHLALHGCQQHQELIGENFYTRSGYNEWAETNNVIVLYPQTTEWIGSIFTAAWRNPNACWDWWGYSGPRYYRKDGKQIRALAEMINTLVGRELLGDTSAP
ncbi:hypothetical protein ACFL1S_02550 [Pseudomonadota bacterium]